MSLSSLNRLFAVGLLLLCGWTAISSSRAWGQEQINRKIKSKVSPIYPELAKQMNLTGIVKVEVTVAANGSVKSAKLIGGHPVLANATLDAVRKWRYETGKEESTGILEFRFDPNK
jgi:TonB family protein